MDIHQTQINNDVLEKFPFLTKVINNSEDQNKISSINAISTLEALGMYTSKTEGLNSEAKNIFFERTIERWYTCSHWQKENNKLPEFEMYLACNILSVKGKWLDKDVKHFASFWGYTIDRNTNRDPNVPFSVYQSN